MQNKQYCGFVALIGRPNVGKSTLLNQLLGRKLSITSRKPQTTRHRLLGIKTIDNTQIIYIDTPGIHFHEKHEMNRYMNRAAKSVLQDVDVIVFIVDGQTWHREDQMVLEIVREIKIPVILAINKIDKIRPKTALLPYIESRSQDMDYNKIVPIAALKGENVAELEHIIMQLLPESEFLYSPDQISDRSDQFIISETIREKLIRQLGEELPYSSTVTIDEYEEKTELIRVAATIWVEKMGQKGIVIGKDGERLKSIGTAARLDLETFFDCKVFLHLWVKVKEHWTDHPQLLKRFGYDVDE